MRVLPLLAACALATAVLPASAQSMKPGLWEIHNKMSGNPEMDQAMAEMQKQFAGMSAAERKQVEAMMAKQGIKMATPSAGGGMAVQVCMTKEMVERNEMPVQDGCKSTVNQRSGNTIKHSFTCTNPPSSGEGQVTFAGDQAYTSKMAIKTVSGGKTETTTMEGRGKWLKADCGNVKPLGAAKK